MESSDNSDVERLLGAAAAREASADADITAGPGAPPASAMPYFNNLFLSCVNMLVHCLISVNAFVLLWFASTTTAWSAFQLHVVFSVIGYEILMAHGILSMYPANSWSAGLRYSHRRRAHWVMQLLGSGLAAAGSIIMILSKEVHFKSIHGKLALAALIITGVSLLNGLTSLYATELRRFIPPAVSKLSHVVLGTAAYSLSMSCLCYGFLKRSFVEWSSQNMAYLMIAVTVATASIVIFVPTKKMISKSIKLFRGLRSM